MSTKTLYTPPPSPQSPGRSQESRMSSIKTLLRRSRPSSIASFSALSGYRTPSPTPSQSPRQPAELEEDILHITNNRRHSMLASSDEPAPKAPKESRIPWTSSRPTSPPPTPQPNKGEFLPFIPLPALPYFLPPLSLDSPQALPKPKPSLRRDAPKVSLAPVAEAHGPLEVEMYADENTYHPAWSSSEDGGALTPDDVASALELFPLPPDRSSMEEARDDAQSITKGKSGVGLGLGDPFELVAASKSKKRGSIVFSEEDEADERRDTFALHSRRESDANRLFAPLLSLPSRSSRSSATNAKLGVCDRVENPLLSSGISEDKEDDAQFWRRLRAVEQKKKRRESWTAGSRAAASAEVKRSRRRSMDALVVALGM